MFRSATDALDYQSQTPLAHRARVEWVDYAKGICIILVVFGHALGGTWAAFLLAPYKPLLFLTGMFYCLRMPTLFFLSGLFLYRSVQKKPGVFLLDRLGVLLYPCMLWSFIHSGCRWLISSNVNKGPGLRAVLMELPYHPFGELWFLYVLFMICVLFLALRELKAPPVVFLIVGIVLYPLYYKLQGRVWDEALLACKFSLYTAAGYFLASRVSLSLLKLPTFAYLGLALLLFAALAWWNTFTSYESMLAGPVLAMMGGGGVIMLAKWMEAVHVGSVIKYIGSRSLQVYLAHPLATAGVRIVLGRRLHIGSGLTILFLAFSAGLIFSLTLDRVATWLGAGWLYSLRPAKSKRPTPALKSDPTSSLSLAMAETA